VVEITHEQVDLNEAENKQKKQRVREKQLLLLEMIK